MLLIPPCRFSFVSLSNFQFSWLQDWLSIWRAKHWACEPAAAVLPWGLTRSRNPPHANPWSGFTVPKNISISFRICNAHNFHMCDHLKTVPALKLSINSAQTWLSFTVLVKRCNVHALLTSFIVVLGGFPSVCSPWASCTAVADFDFLTFPRKFVVI